MASNKEPGEVRKLGILFETMQDDIQKILDVVSGQQASINKMPRMSERLEEIEYSYLELNWQQLGHIMILE